MTDNDRIKEVLEETEILKSPDRLISTTDKTTLHYYVLAEPFYLEALENEGPETKIREGEVTWEKPRLLTPDYIMDLEGFSENARKAMKMMARSNPDLAGLLYKMHYKKKSIRETTVSRELERTYKSIEEDVSDDDENLTVIIKGIDEYWDVSLMKFIQNLVIKSAYKSQIPDYEDRGYLRINQQGQPMVTRNLDGLPIAASEEIESMFARVEAGELDPAELKKELDRWGVFPEYEDRFFDLFRKE